MISDFLRKIYNVLENEKKKEFFEAVATKSQGMLDKSFSSIATVYEIMKIMKKINSYKNQIKKRRKKIRSYQKQIAKRKEKIKTLRKQIKQLEQKLASK